MTPYPCRGCGKIPTTVPANLSSNLELARCASHLDDCPIAMADIYVTVETWNRVFGRNPHTQNVVGPVCKCGNCSREYIGLDGCPYCMVARKQIDIGNLEISVKFLKEQLEFANKVLGQMQQPHPAPAVEDVMHTAAAKGAQDQNNTDAYQIGALAMCHYYHGEHASDEWKRDHAGRALREEHIEWAKANYNSLGITTIPGEPSRGVASFDARDLKVGFGQRAICPTCGYAEDSQNHLQHCR